MMSVSSGDLQGVWLSISGYLVVPSIALLLGNAILRTSVGYELLPVRHACT
jgi:hypothetical protein